MKRRDLLRTLGAIGAVTGVGPLWARGCCAAAVARIVRPLRPVQRERVRARHGRVG